MLTTVHWCIFAILLTPFCAQASSNFYFTVDSDHDASAEIDELRERISSLEEIVESRTQCQEQTVDCTQYIRDCSEVEEQDNKSVYQIRPWGAPRPFNVTCLFDDDGKWTILQRRVDGSTDFNRSWKEYKHGFGIQGDSMNNWLGLDYMNLILAQRQYTVRFDLEDWEDVLRYAEYRYFMIHDEAHGYQLNVTDYSGSLPDNFGSGPSEQNSNGMKFSTFDVENDLHASDNCAVDFSAGWWYRDCYTVNLNGPYSAPPHNTGTSGIQWLGAIGDWYSMKKSALRIKPTFDD